MRHFRVYVAPFAVALTIAFILSFKARSGRGQAQDPKADARVKPTVLITGHPGAIADSAPSAFAAAAAQNAVLTNELTWTFGGKQQHGWYLYDALIKQMLNTEEGPASNGFAAALARWQEKTGLEPSGVLDEASLNAMVSEWQGMRLKDRELAQPDQLIMAPASDFYDPERKPELRQVERATYAAYKRMVAAAVADRSLGLASTPNGELALSEKYLKLLSAFRSREYQEELRRKFPNAGRAGLAVNSPHFTGRALDFYVGGDPVETKDPNRALQVKTPVYQWLVHNAGRFGFRPYFYEPWHWEYVGGEGSKQ